MNAQTAIARVQACLRSDFLKPKYRRALKHIAKVRRPFYGQCYVAAESVFHILGGKAKGWVPVNMKTKTGPHWFIKNKHTNEIIDPTAKQFACGLDYNKGIGKGFLTKKPSKNAQKVISCVKARFDE